MSSPVAFEIDHLFVLASADAPERASLIELGLIEGSANRHRGQGTANRRFFFRNAMLELLWVESLHEARKQPALRLHLADRWERRTAGASPFGICLRPAASALPWPPFAHWLYRPGYSPVALPIATNSSDISEPLLFFVPAHRRPDALPPSRREPLAHPLGVEEITALRMHAPSARSEELRSLPRLVPNIAIVPAGTHMMEIVFDHGRAQRAADLTPALPLLLRW